LGIAIEPANVAAILESLEMQVVPSTEGWRVTPPSFRFDVAIEEDLIEEVGRLFGYDAIPATPAVAVEQLGLASELTLDGGRVADVLVARGYTEAITYTFIDPALESLVNPGALSV
jgi:phenylalanyl-tRNA synthetase beta chain